MQVLFWFSFLRFSLFHRDTNVELERRSRAFIWYNFYEMALRGRCPAVESASRCPLLVVLPGKNCTERSTRRDLLKLLTRVLTAQSQHQRAGSFAFRPSSGTWYSSPFCRPAPGTSPQAGRDAGADPVGTEKCCATRETYNQPPDQLLSGDRMAIC